MSTRQPPMVIALGGNAISPAHANGNLAQQLRNTRESARHLADLIAGGTQLVITHGNGPQVGAELLRGEIARCEVPPLPLDMCGAQTQATIGYMIGQCLDNELHARNIARRTCTIITTVEVDRDDPAFRNPTKPIGGYYTADEARERESEDGWEMRNVPGDGRYRRVVPSPIPQTIVQIDLIQRLTQAGEIVIAAGGGGIPVTRDAAGDWIGVEGVIDKDRTSALLATQLGASGFVIATGVSRVALRYGERDQRDLEQISLAQAREFLAQGHFPPGSMGPKIEAAIAFLENTAAAEAQVIISDLEHLADALAGQNGTWIEKKGAP